ncbi:MAG: serine protease, partial [Gammaproteobacteria bacterium]|nr:serine protease [Gammaproteobacteria bacterium]NNJ51224.1 trypsin-like peptidase domain-containing protein [Gammaproteobacteria bacterium]
YTFISSCTELVNLLFAGLWMTYMLQYRFFLSGFLLCLFPLISYADDTATRLFERNAPLVYQVKVIDKASGNKSIIGSGFQVTRSGVIATNYHVVSDYVLDTDRYSIEILDHEDNSHRSSLISFDIVHDLALLQTEGLDEQELALSQQTLAQGNRIYSMGNPNDLGMTIVEGTYNGLVEASRYNKYLFSGSLNPGMSGGPVFDSDGDVIGINVSKGGEQISFLVPVRHLVELMSHGYEPLSTDDYNAHAVDYLVNDQDIYYRSLLDAEWLTRDFIDFELPDKIDDSLKCWGHSEDDKDVRYQETHRHCKAEDEIYLNSDFYTGSFNFDYISISSEELNTIQFYKLLESNYSVSSFSNSYDKQETTNFACHTKFINIGSKSEQHETPWKVTSCIRAYVEYEGLYDAGLIAMYADSSGGRHDALRITLKTSGISKQNIARLHKKFMDKVRWKH